MSRGGAHTGCKIRMLGISFGRLHGEADNTPPGAHRNCGTMGNSFGWMRYATNEQKKNNLGNCEIVFSSDAAWAFGAAAVDQRLHDHRPIDPAGFQ